MEQAMETKLEMEMTLELAELWPPRWWRFY
jgi:hypothetical protein